MSSRAWPLSRAESVEDGVVPMFAAYSLGKAQELLFALGQIAPELCFVLHDSAARMTTIYEELGYAMPSWEVLGAETVFDGKVVIAPPSAIRSQQLRRIKQRVTAMVSGWGIDPSARFRYQVDEVFPLSDHAGYDDLLRYVELINPEVVLTLHGFAGEFARDLRARGREAWSLTGHNQLELFHHEEAAPLPIDSAFAGSGELASLAEVCERVRSAPGRTAKTNLLANYLQTLDDGQLAIAIGFLSGRAFGRTETVRAAQTWLGCDPGGAGAGDGPQRDGNPGDWSGPERWSPDCQAGSGRARCTGVLASHGSSGIAGPTGLAQGTFGQNGTPRRGIPRHASG